MSAPARILVRGPNWAGDLVMATPGFRALAAAYPEARRVLLLRPGLIPLLAGSPWFHEIRPLRASGREPAALWREARALRRERFELAISLPDSFSSALLLRLAGAARIVGYARNGRSWLLHRAVPLPREAGRRVLIARERHVLGLMEAAGAPARGTGLELFVTSEEEAESLRALDAAGVDPERPIAALAPGASFGTSKLWPTRHFAAVGDALAAAGAQVVLLGAPSEHALASRLREGMRAPAADLTAGGSLGRLKAVLRRARVLVCNDAGARHVAVAFGTPCVALFGPTALEKTNLNLERVTALWHDVPCRPCYQRVCPIDHRCLAQLEPRRVIAAALAVLRAGSPLQ